ncbi:hypothetical protein PAMP_020728 [Pampus punctatissimus]
MNHVFPLHQEMDQLLSGGLRLGDSICISHPVVNTPCQTVWILGEGNRQGGGIWA